MQGLHALARHLRTISWWWKDTVPPFFSKRRVAGLPTSCASAAKRQDEIGGGQGRQAGLRVHSLLDDDEGVVTVDVLVALVLVSHREVSAATSGRTLSATPVCTISSMPRRGRANDEALEFGADALSGRSQARAMVSMAFASGPRRGQLGASRAAHDTLWVVVEGLLGGRRVRRL